MGEGTTRDSLERQLAAGAGSLSRLGGEGSVGRGSGETKAGDAEQDAWLGRLANVLVSLGERSHPIALTLPRTIAPTRETQVSGPLLLTPGTGGYLLFPSAQGATFSDPVRAAAPSSRLGLLAPSGLGSRGLALPSPLVSPGRRLHHITPWSVAHAPGRAGGRGARGCACIVRLLLAAHTVHGSEGAREGGTGPSAAPSAVPSLCSSPPSGTTTAAGMPLSPRLTCSRGP